MPAERGDRLSEPSGQPNASATASLPATPSEAPEPKSASQRGVRQPVRITSQGPNGKRTTTTVTTVRADPSSPVRVRAENGTTRARLPRTDKRARGKQNGVAIDPVAVEPAPGLLPAAQPPVKRRAGKPRVRRVTRVVRRVDAWSVFKVSFVFFVAAYAVMLVAGALLWQVGVSTGAIDNIENFIRDLFVQDTFSLDGEKILRASWILGGIFVVAATAAMTTLAVLFNLICDLVGGVKVLVLEEEVVRRGPPVAEPPTIEPEPATSIG